MALVVADKDNHLGFPADLFYGIEAIVDADAGACPAAAHGAAPLALELQLAALAPLAQEGLLVIVVVVGAGLAVGAAGVVCLALVLGAAVGDGAGEAEDAPAGRLEGPGVGDDTLDARRTAAVERRGGSLISEAPVGMHMAGVDLGVALGRLFVLVEVLIVGSVIGVVAVLRMETPLRVGGLAVSDKHVVELFLLGGGGYGGQGADCPF